MKLLFKISIRACLRNHINYSNDPLIKCPYSKDYNCPFNLLDREIKALLNIDEYDKFQMKSLMQSEAAMNNSFHCKSPDCIGFCIFEDNLNFFDCKRFFCLNLNLFK